LTGEEEQIGGFDLIYKNNKRIKNGAKNVSFLGCLNNRQQHMRKMAKTVALRLADKYKEDRAKEMQKDEKKDSKNIRNKSTNAPSNHTGKSNAPTSNTTIMNKSGNSVQKSDALGSIKLPKVNPTGNSSVSSTSMKAIW
jgi:tubulin polyglutamylase TTLL9